MPCLKMNFKITLACAHLNCPDAALQVQFRPFSFGSVNIMILINIQKDLTIVNMFWIVEDTNYNCYVNVFSCPYMSVLCFRLVPPLSIGILKNFNLKCF